jgi:hypothetical protein
MFPLATKVKRVYSPSTGQVSYSCDTREGLRTSYVYARTSLHRDGIWQVPTIVSFIAPPKQVAADALVGVTPTGDPLTGEYRKVWTGTKSSNWINGLGQIRNSDTSPGPGWRQLDPVPPR